MDSLLPQLAELPAIWVYLIAAALITCETALLPGIVLPTLSTLLLVGFLAERGTVNLWLALAVAAGAAVLGDQLGYLEGRRFGPALRATSAGRRVGPDRWRRLDARLNRYGVPAVMAGRWLAGVRTLVPRLAGAAAMPRVRFTAGSAAAALVWAGAELLAGHAAASLTGAMS
ncbi:DedA family protein [Amycolatopsis nigrescens]|uniref:DedA family protein n=1 Tax=Amycolatopsis nigrescens TaxID=381445 RepID=UPI00039FB52E|nr:DedA family protein [Amycolatopsis nigrescens]